MRAIALISLIALTCVATLSRPHTHAVEACGNSSACAACQLGSNPGEVPAQATAPVANGVELVVEQPATFAPRAQRCLERAPKQGPPAAA